MAPVRVLRHSLVDTNAAWLKAIKLDRFVGAMLPCGLFIR